MKRAETAIKSVFSCILVTWHDQGDRKECYSGLTCLIGHHPTLNRNTITYWLNRRKLPYVTPTLTVERLNLIKPKAKTRKPKG